MRSLVGALSLGVMLLTVPAAAEPESHPLTLRHDGGPLEPSGGGGGGLWKLAAFAAAAGGGLWFYKRRQKATPPAPRDIRIVSRAAIGVRVELVVVEVEGLKMLIGVTPASVQRIATLGVEAEQPVEASPEPDLGERFGALLEGSRVAPRRGDDAIEGQARGLLGLVKR